MKFSEALDSAKEGNFLTNTYFTEEQSLHFYNGDFYYEDGAVLNDRTLESIGKDDWAKDGWTIKYPKEKVDTDALYILHVENKGTMLRDKSYEDCIQHDIIKDVIFNDEEPTKHDYKYFTVVFENNTTRDFHYHKGNPIPTKEMIIGKSFLELRTIAKKMWYDKINENLCSKK